MRDSALPSRPQALLAPEAERRADLVAAAVGHLQVVLPVARRTGELPATLEVVCPLAATVMVQVRFRSARKDHRRLHQVGSHDVDRHIRWHWRYPRGAVRRTCLAGCYAARVLGPAVSTD